MEITVKIDLSRYSDNEIATFLIQGLITRVEFEAWKDLQNSERNCF